AGRGLGGPGDDAEIWLPRRWSRVSWPAPRRHSPTREGPKALEASTPLHSEVCAPFYRKGSSGTWEEKRHKPHAVRAERHLPLQPQYLWALPWSPLPLHHGGEEAVRAMTMGQQPHARAAF